MQSDLQDDRQNERPLGGLFVEKLFQVLANLFFDDCPVAAFLDRGIADCIDEHLPALSKKPLLLNERHTAKDDFRRYFHHAALFIDGDDEKNDAIFRDMAAVADDHFFDLFETAFIDQHSSDLRLSDNLRAGGAKAKDVARLRNDDSVLNDGGLFDNLGMSVQLPIRSVDRDEVFRLHERHHQFQLFLARMSADVYGWLASVGVVNLRAPPIKVIHHAANGALVTRDMPRRKDDGVALFNCEVFVIVQCQP